MEGQHLPRKFSANNTQRSIPADRRQQAKDKHNHCCNNPRRGHPEIKTPTAFFKPCKGKAYTYEEDHDSVSYGQCQGGQVTCCLGYANTCKY